MNSKGLSMLSIAAKAGKVASGGFLAEKAIAEGSASLVIVAVDASGNTKKKFRDKCSFYKVPLVEFSDSDSLGRCIGKEQRTVVAVTDAGLASSIQKKLAADAKAFGLE